MTSEIKKFIISRIESARGDDYARAQRAFKGYTTLKMSQQFGQSGQTCQQILDGYKQFNDKIDEAIKEMNKISTT